MASIGKKSWGRWNPGAMEKVVTVSGALTNATFAVAGLDTDDVLIEVLHLDGATGGIKTVLYSAGSPVTAGDCAVTADGQMLIPSVATNADTLYIRFVDVSAGSEGD